MGRTTMAWGLRNAVTNHLSHGSQNRRTRQSYLSGVREFCAWAKTENIKYYDQLSPEVIQRYANHLVAAGKTAATVHTRLAPVCVGARVSMSEISKPKRTVSKIVRGRVVDANPDGHRQLTDSRYARLVSLQGGLGIRRAELAALTGADAVRGKDGRVEAVMVRRGKGGKRQKQWILPSHRDAATAVFDGVGPNDRVFSPVEMANKINLHGLRSRTAREAYAYYEDILKRKPDLADRMREGLMKTFDACNDRSKVSPCKRARFEADVYNNKPYRLRGECRDKAVSLGRPTEYNRLAIMMASVYHLAHWRTDVTVVNYLLAEDLDGDAQD